MTSLIHDRGRGPELVGTRITVFDLVPRFLDGSVTESFICRFYDLTPEQVAAARAYIFHNLESTLAEHLQIEQRLAVGNPPEMIEKAKATRDVLMKFKEWLTRREQEEAAREARSGANGSSALPADFPTFREWFDRRESPTAAGA